ncbi:hypothetical protein SAMN02744133_108199 [Thalassospira xiamenensis M-5 = DSM 17429]|uniref:Uncharacterized protein n=1 Tax=Thalassospira xiamenensis M-5 = DSM 17429 TaxID=1123366 RepID=A0AB72UJW5_9PROT|nr:hypothetical protein [Thalassospira xiamenensis]AJD54468.1 hypothetical protein TH3_21978 [Thalassospira xiamenensis M-5 = DSM 17429]SIT22406.1 hypothetical protein SAMN02744133_108199 [Thalassospira xiamenensis M-5 = DSM 17429]
MNHATSIEAEITSYLIKDRIKHDKTETAGLRHTRDIADYLGMPLPATRKILHRLADEGMLHLYEPFDGRTLCWLLARDNDNEPNEIPTVEDQLKLSGTGVYIP